MSHFSKQQLSKELVVENQSYRYFSLQAAEQMGLGHFSKLPRTLKILLENVLRHWDGVTVTEEHIRYFDVSHLGHAHKEQEISFYPTRVLMQDFTGVPAIVDLAAMRDAMSKLGGNPELINPLTPVDLVIDHSVQVSFSGDSKAFQKNVDMEMQQNIERYRFLRWGQQAFKHFRVVPPGTGICHQVNLEYLAQVVWSSSEQGHTWLSPDTLIGTDSHTTMINGLGVLGWGVGGIEAEAAMLGQPISMLIPPVIGFKLDGRLKEGITATDLVLTITELLRKKGVVGKFVEFYGPGLLSLSLADRATIANMAPEYGATCGYFPVDDETLRYLQLTNRSEQQIALVRAYAQAQGLWNEGSTPEFSDEVSLDLSKIEPCLAGPKRPQDRVLLSHMKTSMQKFLKEQQIDPLQNSLVAVPNKPYPLAHGSVVIAAITSCTNTSNPSVLIAAGLLAQKAVAKGLKTKPWVKTSLAPGSKVVTEYLKTTGLQTYLDQLGFNLVGYGCTTCIGNSGPLPEDDSKIIQDRQLLVSAVLSGNRNFEGRVHPLVKANWLASPPLVVAFALAGTTLINLDEEPIGMDLSNQPVYLKDIWPTPQEIQACLASVDRTMFQEQYAGVFEGDAVWSSLPTPTGQTYAWENQSTYIKHPPYFEGMSREPGTIQEIHNARILALFGDSITTDHISPAGNIKASSPAGLYLQEHQTAPKDFNSYGARRGNHEVMMRGTFANIRIKNEMMGGREGGMTVHYPSQEELSIFDAAMRYQDEQIPLIIIAGKEYGSGSSRDWAAKGPYLQGVKAVIAESFERIHRSNLVGMGILPLEFTDNTTRHTLDLEGSECISLLGLNEGLKPCMPVNARILRQNGTVQEVTLKCRIDTQREVEYYQHGGILPYMIRQLLKKSS